MPHFQLITNEDGSIAQILCDGVPYQEAVRLEPAYAIVSTYFKLAAGNLNSMTPEKDAELRRFHGLQAFLMSLTGVEAFTNVFFLIYGRERQDARLLEINAERFGPLVPRLARLIDQAFAAPLAEQDQLLTRIRELYQLRNTIVHPRWNPTSMTLGGPVPVHIDGLIQNFQATFENASFCREAFLWCLLLVVRIASAAGNTDPAAFCFFWTGVTDLREDQLTRELAS